MLHQENQSQTVMMPVLINVNKNLRTMKTNPSLIHQVIIKVFVFNNSIYLLVILFNFLIKQSQKENRLKKKQLR